MSPLQPIHKALEFALRDIIKAQGVGIIDTLNEFDAGTVSISVDIKASIRGEDHHFKLTLAVDPDEKEVEDKDGGE